MRYKKTEEDEARNPKTEGGGGGVYIHIFVFCPCQHCYPVGDCPPGMVTP